MAALVLAHAGHWAVSLLYFLPVLVLGGAVLWARRRSPAPEDEAGSGGGLGLGAHVDDDGPAGRP